MPTDKFIFKVYCDGYIERIRDCNNITFSDVTRWLGVTSTDIECRPLKDSEIWAFYGNEQSKVLIFAVPERKFRHTKRGYKDFIVHGIGANQFNMLSTPQSTVG
jgi:hypothetical protein